MGRTVVGLLSETQSLCLKFELSGRCFWIVSENEGPDSAGGLGVCGGDQCCADQW